MSAEIAHRERGATAQILRHVEAARDRDISARATAANRAHLQRAAFFHTMRTSGFQCRAVQCRVHIGARDGDSCIVAKPQCGPNHGAFQRGRAFLIADQNVGQA